jgi:hypothetical protein
MTVRTRIALLPKQTLMTEIPISTNLTIAPLRTPHTSTHTRAWTSESRVPPDDDHSALNSLIDVVLLGRADRPRPAIVREPYDQRVMRATRRVQAEAVRDLLEAAPRANTAFWSGEAIEAAPVAFRLRAGRYCGPVASGTY